MSRKWSVATMWPAMKPRSSTMGLMTHAATLCEIHADPARGTVWINGADGSCIGRFSKRFGIDVHRTATAQLAGESECIVCTHERSDRMSWARFIDAMQEHHGVTVAVDLLSWP